MRPVSSRAKSHPGAEWNKVTACWPEQGTEVATSWHLFLLSMKGWSFSEEKLGKKCKNSFCNETNSRAANWNFNVKEEVFVCNGVAPTHLATPPHLKRQPPSTSSPKNSLHRVRCCSKKNLHVSRPSCLVFYQLHLAGSLPSEHGSGQVQIARGGNDAINQVENRKKAPLPIVFPVIKSEGTSQNRKECKMKDKFVPENCLMGRSYWTSNLPSCNVWRICSEEMRQRMYPVTACLRY